MIKMISIAAAVMAIAGSAQAQMTNTMCSQNGTFINCNSYTQQSAQFNVGSNNQINLEGIDSTEAIARGQALGRQMRLNQALRQINLNDPYSIDRAINVAVQVGAMDQAVALQRLAAERRYQQQNQYQSSTNEEPVWNWKH